MQTIHLTVDHFKECRTTSNGLFAVIDAIAHVKQTKMAKANDCLRYIIRRESKQDGVTEYDIREKLGITMAKCTKDTKLTYVCTFDNLVQVLSRLSGQVGKAIRAQLAKAKKGVDTAPPKTDTIANNEEEEEPATVVVANNDEEEEEPATAVVATNEKPVLDLDILNMSVNSFKGCRITPTGLISVIDAIMLVKGCKRKRSQKFWQGIMKKSESSDSFALLPLQLRFQFTGERQNPTPVAKLTNLIKILSHLPGKEGKSIRAQCARIAAKVIVDRADNPVLKLDLMNLTVESFKGCRITSDGMLSIIDAICFVKGCDRNRSAQFWNEIQKNSLQKNLKTVNFSKFKFSGERQRDTPVANFTDLLEILSYLPGKEGKVIRAQQANLATRAIVGDHDLEAALPARRAAVPAVARAAAMKGLASSSSSKRKLADEIREETKQAPPKRVIPEMSDDDLMLIAQNMAPGLKTFPRQMSSLWKWCEGNPFKISVEVARMQAEVAKMRAEFSKASAAIAQSGAVIAQSGAIIAKADFDKRSVVYLENLRLKKDTVDIAHTKELHELKLELVKGDHTYNRDLSKSSQAEITAHTKKHLDEDRLARQSKPRRRRQVNLIAKSVLEEVRRRHFGDKLQATCGAANCRNVVSAVASFVGIAKGQVHALADNLTIVCWDHSQPEHDLFSRVEKHKVAPERVGAWIHRNGDKTSVATCGACGQDDCRIHVWSGDAQVCHIEAQSRGGADATENYVVGRGACNLQQGDDSLKDYRRRIGADESDVPVAVALNDIPMYTKAFSSMLKRDKGSAPSKRAERAVKRLQQKIRAQKAQQTISVSMNFH